MTKITDSRRTDAHLTDAHRDRYRRNIDVPGLGEVGQAALLAARVLVIGAGGLGTPVLTYLAAAGVGRIGIMDFDRVEVMNLQRQAIHDTGAVGENKAVSAARRIAALNPDVVVDVYPEAATGQRLADLLPGYDMLIDCTDTFGAKLMLSDAAEAAGTPFIWGAAVGMQYQVSVFGVPDRAGTRRYLRSLFPAEPDEAHYPRAVDIGVLGAMVGQAGSAMATEAIKLITGVGRLLSGRMLVADAAAGRWDVVAIAPQEALL